MKKAGMSCIGVSRDMKEPRENGFTLIELMIVILVIAILVGVAVPVFLATRTRADEARTEANHRIG